MIDPFDIFLEPQLFQFQPPHFWTSSQKDLEEFYQGILHKEISERFLSSHIISRNKEENSKRLRVSLISHFQITQFPRSQIISQWCVWQLSDYQQNWETFIWDFENLKKIFGNEFWAAKKSNLAYGTENLKKNLEVVWCGRKLIKKIEDNSK